MYVHIRMLHIWFGCLFPFRKYERRLNANNLRTFLAYNGSTGRAWTCIVNVFLVVCCVCCCYCLCCCFTRCKCCFCLRHLSPEGFRCWYFSSGFIHKHKQKQPQEAVERVAEHPYPHEHLGCMYTRRMSNPHDVRHFFFQPFFCPSVPLFLYSRSAAAAASLCQVN